MSNMPEEDLYTNNVHAGFDVGNVLVKVDLTKFTSKLQPLLPPEHDATDFLNSIQALQDIGLTTVRQSLQARYNIHKSEVLQMLMDAWDDVIEPCDLMLNFMQSLKSEGAKLALLSNIGREHHVTLKKKVPEIFHNTIHHLSYEVGARKPTHLYYQSFLKDHDDFVGAIYVDDLDENLRSGKKYSFKSFKFCLDEILQQPLSRQKKELDKIKSYIFNRKYDSHV